MNKAVLSLRTRKRSQGGGAVQSQGGFTLVELMVSLVIGLLIVLALITLLTNVNRNNSEMSKTNRVIENGRFALQLLEADIAHAGYWGGHVPQFDNLTATVVPTDYPTAIPDPCLPFDSPWTPTHKSNLVGIVVQGYEIPSVVPSPTLSVCATRVTSPKANTDVLFVRHAELCAVGDAGCTRLMDNELYFQVARCGTAAPATPYILEKYLASNNAVNDAALFPLQRRNCTTVSERRKFVSSLYYVRNYAVTAGDGVPTLMRSQFAATASSTVPAHQAPEALIEGIEGFRVEYGVDDLSDSGAAVNFGATIAWANPSNKTSPTNRGDGISDGTYVRCTTGTPCTVAQLSNVVAVKLYALARSEQKTPGYLDTKTYNLGSTTLGPFNDEYKRHLFMQTIRLTNVASRRETP